MVIYCHACGLTTKILLATALLPRGVTTTHLGVFQERIARVTLVGA